MVPTKAKEKYDEGGCWTCLSVTILTSHLRQISGVQDIVVATRERKIRWVGQFARLADNQRTSGIRGKKMAIRSIFKEIERVRERNGGSRLKKGSG